MHWADLLAQKLIQRDNNHVIATSTSISGRIHLGNAGDAIFADSAYKALKRLGPKSVKLVWFSEDIDPFRRVPMGLPPSFERYIGMPASSLPCPEGCCHSFVEHYSKMFLRSLKKLGIEPEVHSTTDMYLKGVFEDCVKKAIEKRGEIRKIFKNISGAERPEDWIPFDPICENCGRISTTKPLSYKDGMVEYKCEGGMVRGNWVNGCGHKSFSDLRHGKLPWRVEWAARWSIFKITCEPFGKEHAVSGGSYDTSKVISKVIYGWEPPIPLQYEHILVAGKKMSKSLGNIITLEELLKILEPEVIRFFFFRVKTTTHKDFEIEKGIIPLIKEYERVERLYYGAEHPSKGEDPDELKRIYELSQVEKLQKNFVQIPYAHLATLFQISDDESIITQALEKSDHMRGTEEEIEELHRMLPLVKNFLTTSAADGLRFTIKREFGKEEIQMVGEREKECFGRIAERMDGIKDEDELTNFIYSLSKEMGIKPKDTFRMIYRLFLGQNNGPKAGSLLLSLDKDFVKKRLRLME